MKVANHFKTTPDKLQLEAQHCLILSTDPQYRVYDFLEDGCEVLVKDKASL